MWTNNTAADKYNQPSLLVGFYLRPNDHKYVIIQPKGGWRKGGVLCWQDSSRMMCVRGTYTLCCWRQPTWRRWKPRPPTERRKRRWRRRTWGPWARSSRGPAGTWCERWRSRAPTPLRDEKSTRLLCDGCRWFSFYTTWDTNGVSLDDVAKNWVFFL